MYFFQWQFIMLFSRQGKLRLQKWYTALAQKDKKKITRDLVTIILARRPKMCSFLEYKEMKIVYKRLVVCFYYMFLISYVWTLLLIGNILGISRSSIYLGSQAYHTKSQLVT